MVSADALHCSALPYSLCCLRFSYTSGLTKYNLPSSVRISVISMCTYPKEYTLKFFFFLTFLDSPYSIDAMSFIRAIQRRSRKVGQNFFEC